ncbi:DUF1289 domain-containing protein [Rhodocyclus tenuis]|uniref:DUF1289 domain-containing protein n=1 Tax=Rhodocyclus tenuis TaxID=1066 RepID=UPI001907603A|nr:hypothetical protein [Rhodocyclus tenuis]
MNAPIPAPRSSQPTPAAPAGIADAPPKSPCVDICRMDAERKLCIGCQRTLDEIGGWSGFSDERKRQVLAAVAERRAAGE